MKLFSRTAPARIAEPAAQAATLPLPPLTNPRATGALVEITPAGELRVSWDTPEDVPQVLQQLRLKKREAQLSKREITAEQHQLHAAHTDSVRRRGATVRGGGGVGRFVRGVQAAQHAGERQGLAKGLAPLEQQQAQVDALLLAIDRVILQVQQQTV